MNYKRALLKKSIEQAIVFPFVLLGKIVGQFYKLKTSHNIFLFYSWADIGGSTQVNIDIVNCIKEQKPLIIYSKKPKNNQFADRFKIDGVEIIDLHPYIDNKLFHFVNLVYRGIVASWINSVEKPVVFGGESMFFYKILPYVKKSTLKVELNHTSSWFNYSQQFVNDIDFRILSTPQIKRNAEHQYEENGVPEKYLNRLYFVDNKIEIPPFVKVDNPSLEVIFIGRGSPQKRVHLAVAMAKKLHEHNKNIHFSFVGDVEAFFNEETLHFCKVYGSIKDKDLLNKLYYNSDVLLLTSLYEGLPIVVMEMMARGRVVVSTAVDGIPDYIKHMKNGLLITEKDEEKIVTQGVDLLTLLLTDHNLKTQLGMQSYSDAQAHFSGDKFCTTYRSILLKRLPPDAPVTTQ